MVIKVAFPLFLLATACLPEAIMACCPGDRANIACSNSGVAQCCPNDTWTCPTVTGDYECVAGVPYIGGPPQGVGCLEPAWVYVQPAWWPDIKTSITTDPRPKRCRKEQFPFATGDSCSIDPRGKTCYFGDQVCPNGQPYPTAKCSCIGGGGGIGGTWSCDPLLCEYGSICGSVSEDTTVDGLGDQPQANTPITLKDESGNVVDTTTTDANGNYCFNGLPPECYIVMEMNLPGFLDVSDVDPASAQGTINACIGGAEPLDSTGNDYVNELDISFCYGSISGNVSEDEDNDGTGDFPIPGAVIMLLDISGNMVASILTDFNGNYVFYDLPPGDYIVKETDPSGRTSVRDADGPFNGNNLIELSIGGVEPCNTTGNDFVDE